MHTDKSCKNTSSTIRILMMKLRYGWKIYKRNYREKKLNTEAR